MLDGSDAGRLPGHQAMAQAFGASVVRAAKVMHGKTSPVTHNGQGVFPGLPSPLTVTRYHSLIVDPATLPESVLRYRPESVKTQEIMGIRQSRKGSEGVQFHPERASAFEQGHASAGKFPLRR